MGKHRKEKCHIGEGALFPIGTVFIPPSTDPVSFEIARVTSKFKPKSKCVRYTLLARSLTSATLKFTVTFTNLKGEIDPELTQSGFLVLVGDEVASASFKLSASDKGVFTLVLDPVPGFLNPITLIGFASYHHF